VEIDSGGGSFDSIVSGAVSTGSAASIDWDVAAE
jgi:hypothetical protein